MVLSSASPVFKNILINSSQSHPYIYMKEIDKQELDFTSVHVLFGENHLEKFLECATAGLARNVEKHSSKMKHLQVPEIPYLSCSLSSVQLCIWCFCLHWSIARGQIPPRPPYFTFTLCKPTFHLHQN